MSLFEDYVRFETRRQFLRRGASFMGTAAMAAVALMAAMQAADIDCRRVHISVVEPISQLVAQAQGAARGAQGARVRRDTRRGAVG